MHTCSWIIHETYNLEMDMLILYCLPLLVRTMGRSLRPVQPKYDDQSIYLSIYCWCCSFFLARLILVGLVDLSAPPSRETSCLCEQLYSVLWFVRSCGRAGNITCLRLYYAHVNILSHVADIAHVRSRTRPSPFFYVQHWKGRSDLGTRLV